MNKKYLKWVLEVSNQEYKNLNNLICEAKKKGLKISK